MPRRARPIAAALLCALLAGCSSAVTGQGGSASKSPIGSGSGGFQPQSSSSSAVSSASSESSSAQAAPITVVSVTGSNSGASYTVYIWAVSHILDCAHHAYGAPMITFLRAHPCTSATRRLLTVDLHGRTVVMSTIAVTFPPASGSDAYATAGEFAKLEKSNGTGSMNDLLREGAHIPGAQNAIPADEAFEVIGQDNTVTVFDAWYEQGSTSGKEALLAALERDLFLTPVSVDS